MKFIIASFIFFFSTSLYSADGDNYFCKSTNIVKVYKLDTESFQTFDFNFKKNKNNISFGKGGYFDEQKMSVKFTAGEYFYGGDDWDIFIYNDGIFTYSSLLNAGEEDVDSLTIIANCKIF